MELLTKKDPDMDKIIEEDKVDNKRILNDTNAIYRNFDPRAGKFNSDRFEKWNIISNKLFPYGFKKEEN
jgi:hypothetical protein